LDLEIFKIANFWHVGQTIIHASLHHPLMGSKPSDWSLVASLMHLFYFMHDYIPLVYWWISLFVTNEFQKFCELYV